MIGSSHKCVGLSEEHVNTCFSPIACCFLSRAPLHSMCLVKMVTLLYFMFQIFESPSLDSEMTDDIVQASTSEAQNQVLKTQSPKKMAVVSI
jgi:hypothetical protein